MSAGGMATAIYIVLNYDDTSETTNLVIGIRKFHANIKCSVPLPAFETDKYTGMVDVSCALQCCRIVCQGLLCSPLNVEQHIAS